MPKIEIEWKLNPATIFTFVVAAASVIAGFTQARADINRTSENVLDLQQWRRDMVELEHQSELNSATTNQILKDYGRRIERLEDK